MNSRAAEAIVVRGACQNNLKNLDIDLPHGELIVVTGSFRLGQILAGFRHALRGRATALRRDILPLREAVPRSLDNRMSPASKGFSGHRHRPGQSGTYLALDRRHDDRDQRSPEAPVRAHRAPALPAMPRPVRRDSAPSIAETCRAGEGGRQPLC